jgi:ATP-binding cassette subfamily F protein 3
MIHFQDVSLRRGGTLLFEHATLAIHPGQKIGVTGANGSGKSSLFALLLGDIQADAGDLVMPPGLVLAHLAQESHASAEPAVEYVMDGDKELRAIEAGLQQAEKDVDGIAAARLHARLDGIGGYTARARAGRLMSGLGFRREDAERPFAEFSGGWRVRLNLAKALMCRSDLLLLDEPTNHLDLDAAMWLQDWLAGYRGTLLLISHDRDVLDETTDHTIHIDDRKVSLHSGNYSAFQTRRAELLAQQQAAYERQQCESDHIRAFVDRFRAKATKARQAQSRLKALAKMELIARARVDSPFRFTFQQPDKLPNPLLRLEQADAAYGSRTVLQGINLCLSPGDRIGLLGPNGAGKSTLIKLLAGTLEPVHGVREAAQDLRLGYFSQHQVDQLRFDWTPLQHLRDLDPRATEKALRSVLGGFGFSGEKALAEVAPFSGGEKARLALALLLYQKPNLLLLDEPTNHLDIELRDALTLALLEFAGALVVVSHDRHLLRASADDFWLIADGGVRSFSGDLAEYRRWLTNRCDQEPPRAESSEASRKHHRRQEAAKRQQLRPLQVALQQAEVRLDQLLEERTRLEHLLTDSALYHHSAKERLKALLAAKSQLDSQVGEAEAAWLQAGEALELAEHR